MRRFLRNSIHRNTIYIRFENNMRGNHVSWNLNKMIFIEYFFLRRETIIQLHNLRVETFNPTFVSTHHTRKQVRMKLSWASTRDRVVCQLGESRNGKKSWRIFERESESELANERAKEREREIVFRIHRTYPTFAKCVPNYATSVPPPSPREYPLFHPCEEARTTFNPFPEFRRPLATHLSRIFRTFFPP